MSDYTREIIFFIAKVRPKINIDMSNLRQSKVHLYTFISPSPSSEDMSEINKL